MDGQVIIDWNIPNLITVTLMVLIAFTLISFAWRVVRGARRGAAAPTDGAAAA